MWVLVRVLVGALVSATKLQSVGCGAKLTMLMSFLWVLVGVVLLLVVTAL